MKNLSSRSCLIALAWLVACSGKLNVNRSDEPSGGSGGSSTQSEGGSGANVTKPVTQSPIGNADDCPAASPSAGDGCAREGAGCGYPSQDDSQWECLCVEWGLTDLRWQCDFEYSSPSCPIEPVEDGADCFGLFGSSCSYPIATTCSCAAETGTWQCFGPQRPDFPKAPTAPKPSTPINELTESDRDAWCDWFGQTLVPPGYPPPEDAPVGPNGWTMNGCSYSGGPACNVTVPTLSPRQCAQNLGFSSCRAPIAELTDCITTAFSSCIPAPHGCARYLQSPGCDGTMVTGTTADAASSGGTAGTSSSAGTTGASPAGGASPGGGASPEEGAGPGICGTYQVE